MNDCSFFFKGGCNEEHAMELTLILLTELMCKDPAIFLQCSFSPVSLCCPDFDLSDHLGVLNT